MLLYFYCRVYEKCDVEVIDTHVATQNAVQAL